MNLINPFKICVKLISFRRHRRSSRWALNTFVHTYVDMFILRVRLCMSVWKGWSISISIGHTLLVHSSNVNTRPISDIYLLHFIAIAIAIEDTMRFGTNEWFVSANILDTYISAALSSSNELIFSVCLFIYSNKPQNIFDWNAMLVLLMLVILLFERM